MQLTNKILSSLSIETYLAVIIFVTLFFAFKRRRKSGSVRNSTRTLQCRSSPLPSLEWTPYKLPAFVNGIISMWRLRKYGIIEFERFAVSTGKFTFKCPIGPYNFTWIGDTEIIRKILKSTSSLHLNKPRFLYDNLFVSFFKNGLIGADVETWLPHRKATSLAFNYKAYSAYLTYMNEAGRALAMDAFQELNKSSSGVALDNLQMKKLIYHHSVALISRVIMGSQFSSFSHHELEKFHETVSTAKDIVSERFVNPLLMVPAVWRWHPRRKLLKAMLEHMANFSKEVINRYRQNGLTIQEGILSNVDVSKPDLELETGRYASVEETTEKSVEADGVGTKQYRCLVEQMIVAGLSDKEIANEVGTFLTAGYETVTTAMEMLIFHLASNPAHLRKCQEEIDALFGPKTTSSKELFNSAPLLDREDLSKMKYLERCILESLRLTPPIPAFGRRVDTSFRVTKDLILDKNQILLISPWLVHRNPANYPNPHVFDPDRFLPENISQRHPYSFIPFSMGMRNCIGWKMALMELKVFMAWLLRCFDWSTLDTLNDVNIGFEITLKLHRPFRVTFTSRIEN